MITLKKDWSDDYVVSYTKCQNCGNVWVRDEDILVEMANGVYCPECGIDDWDDEDLTVGEIKKLEQDLDEKPFYEIVE